MKQSQPRYARLTQPAKVQHHRLWGVPALLFSILILVGAGSPLRAQPDPAELPYSALYVFGDSWTWTAGGPYWNSHWSNGPMWPEILCTNWGMTYVPARNYAGAATTSDVINSQIPRFTGSSNAATALFVIWAGGNDFWYQLFPNNTLNPYLLTNATAWNNLFVTMTRNLSNSVVRLYQRGARTVIVQELDEVERSPGFASRLNSTQKVQVGEWVQSFNRALKDTLNALDARLADLRLLKVGFHDRWNEFLDQAVSLGFTRTDVGALDDPVLTNKSYTGPGKDYVFWDANHPTSRTHAVWAEWIGEAATQSRTELLHLVVRSNSIALELTKLKPGRAYTLEVSSNLVDWAEQESFTAEEGTNTLAAVPPAGNPATRLFRLSWKP
jgi:phospholipase/lecithinase/hemolysin